jgi:hypothetical protein
MADECLLHEAIVLMLELVVKGVRASCFTCPAMIGTELTNDGKTQHCISWDLTSGGHTRDRSPYHSHKLARTSSSYLFPCLALMASHKCRTASANR